MAPCKFLVLLHLNVSCVSHHHCYRTLLICVCVCVRGWVGGWVFGLGADTFDLADIDPLGPVATARQMCKGDVFVSVDPGEELLKV